MITSLVIDGWTITSGDGYGQPEWVEASRADGAYIIIDTVSMAIMEDGHVDEHGQPVTLPADVTAAIWARAL